MIRMNRIKLPISTADFERIREGKFYYIDKTRIISRIISDDADFILFTRPRRFGKTTLQTMLRSFFDIRKNSVQLFSGLDIEKDEAAVNGWMNKYPVIYLSLKDIDGATFESALYRFREIIIELFTANSFILDTEISKSDRNLFMKLMSTDSSQDDIAGSLKFLVRLIPYVLTWFMFTGLYIFMPNTKVKFRHAFTSGIIAGTAYQAFQYLYIDSQIWVSKYNAIYGSFAAIPLFLLWLQISWTICLFGTELTYAGQNIRNFNFEKDTKNISRRYRDFVCILVMSIICKRFEKDEKPYTAEEISLECRIPIRLVHQVLYQLQEIHVLYEITPEDNKSNTAAYLPALDIYQLNVALLLDRLDTYGSEDFKIDRDKEFRDQWSALLQAREEYYRSSSKILLKDL